MPDEKDKKQEEEKEEEQENLLETKVEGEETMKIDTTGVIEDEKEEVEEEKEEEEVEEEPFRTFKTQEEFDEFIAEERKKLEELEKPDEEEEEKEEEEIKFFDDDWKPKDWNDFTLSLLKNPTARRFLAQNMAGEVRTEIENLTAAERKELEDINEEYNKEYDQLAKEGKVPDRSTPEGKVIDQQISTLGALYGQTSIVKSYELWSKIPKDQGGGLDYESPSKTKLSEQKKKSGKIGSGRKGTKTDTTKTKKYEDVHTKSLDEQVQEALDE